MSKSHGKNGRVKVSATLVAETRAWTLQENVPVQDATAQGDSWQEHLTGIPGWTANVTCYYDPADANGQEAFTIGASVDVEFYTDGDGTGKTYKSGTATVIDRGQESPVDGNNMLEIGLQGNGALTQSTVGA
ncbi:hypothetical protein [Oceaniradius stylonematis]|uniref:hypothetical protein n=1 Tax=Oceaniradius stylonematis TaxID=2184161 RepID=UPI003B5AB712